MLHLNRLALGCQLDRGEADDVRGVHLVDGHDEQLEAEGVGEEGVLPGMGVLGDASLKLSGTQGDAEHYEISLGYHVFDEIPVPGAIVT